jgi:RNA-binding protein NOB1
MSVSSLVLDSGAFISGAQLTKFGANTSYITTPRVLAELRDSATRQAVEQFPFEIQTRTVSDDALNAGTQLSDVDICFNVRFYLCLFSGAVRVFAKKTGDLAVLSGTDVEIIALTYMLEKEANGLKNIRTEPVRDSQIIGLLICSGLLLSHVLMFSACEHGFVLPERCARQIRLRSRVF